MRYTADDLTHKRSRDWRDMNQLHAQVLMALNNDFLHPGLMTYAEAVAHHDPNPIPNGTIVPDDDHVKWRLRGTPVVPPGPIAFYGPPINAWVDSWVNVDSGFNPDDLLDPPPLDYTKGGAANLRIVATSTGCTLTFDYIRLRDLAGRDYFYRDDSPISVSILIGNSGAGGLDTGTASADTHYYIWVGYNPGTDTLAGWLSTSYDNPTKPSGYFYTGLVGSLYRGATDIVDSIQMGNHLWFKERVNLVTGLSATTVTAITPTTSALPHKSVLQEVLLGGFGTNATLPPVVLSSHSSGYNMASFDPSQSPAEDDPDAWFDASGYAEYQYLPITDAGTLYYKVDSSGASITLCVRAMRYNW